MNDPFNALNTMLMSNSDYHHFEDICNDIRERLRVAIVNMAEYLIDDPPIPKEDRDQMAKSVLELVWLEEKIESRIVNLLSYAKCLIKGYEDWEERGRPVQDN